MSLVCSWSHDPTTTLNPIPDVRRVVNFLGTLRGREGSVPIVFAIYKDQQGGAPLWIEVQKLQLDPDGRYTVQLGLNHREGWPDHLFENGRPLWLSAKPNRGCETPRILLLPVTNEFNGCNVEIPCR